MEAQNNTQHTSYTINLTKVSETNLEAGQTSKEGKHCTVTFTEENLNEKLYFLSIVNIMH